MMIFNYFLMTVIVVVALYISLIKNHINALLAYGIFGAALSAIFFILNAPDVAIVEITVGAAFIFFIYLIAMKKVGKIKVYYVLTPYLVEKKQNTLTGFEFYIIDKFVELKGLEVEYIQVEENEAIEKLEKDGDVLIGGHTNTGEKNIITSKEILPTKILSVGNPKISSYGLFEDDKDMKNDLENFNDDFLIDLIRYKYLLYLGKTFESNEIGEYKTSGYKFVFNSKNEFLKEEFDEFIDDLKKNNQEEYQEMIRRYIG